ncbi:MAG: nucleotidyltransferase family protein [Bacteroidales bacterium]|nr:nucleotidyltransferase family protein [Bacteroidales bacterium]
MNSQETLWFIGKCLSLAVHPERALEIQKVLQSGKVSWESLVYQSSNQLVLPALYLNLKRNNLLEFLPDDLCEHLEDITDQNRERNRAILNQVEDITTLLRSNNLKPVYLKGTAHLLDGLYEDIAERMLSDIDLLLEENEAKRAWDLLKNKGYVEHNKFGETAFGEHRHLNELIKDNKIASVEVHRRLLEGEYDKKFNWKTVKGKINKSQSPLGALILSDKDMTLHNMMNVQMNDKAKSTYKLLLRQSYDLMLLAKRENPLEISKKFGYYFDKLNTYIALSANILDSPNGLDYKDTPKIKRYIYRIKLIWKYPTIANFSSKIYFIFFRIYRYITQFFLFFFKSSVRKRIISSLKNPDYYKAHWAMYKKWFS